jgi:hypothetical protein
MRTVRRTVGSVLARALHRIVSQHVQDIHLQKRQDRTCEVSKIIEIDAPLRNSRDIRGIDQDLTNRRPRKGAEIISTATGLLYTRLNETDGRDASTRS